MYIFQPIIIIFSLILTFSQAQAADRKDLHAVIDDNTAQNCIFRVNRHFCLGQLWSSNLKFELHSSEGDVDNYRIYEDEDELPLFATMTVTVQYDTIMKIRFTENKSWLPIKSGITIDEIRNHYLTKIPKNRWITSNRFERWANIGKVRITLENRKNGDVTIALRKAWQPELY